ncbi:MAG: hypothetical protein M3Y13_12760 [Armatimonadota bacterium]|nr:hypothetical protein [Armatimonadota bacterium]
MIHTGWYITLNLFEHVFYGITDLIYLVFACLVVGLASRPGLRHHLRWANATAASCFLGLLARSAVNLHYFFGIWSREGAYITSFLFYAAAAISGIYSTVVFWRTFRDLADRADHPDPLAPEPQPGVWPPPPTFKQE